MKMVTRVEAEQRLREICSKIPAWTPEKVEREVESLRRRRKGTRLLIETTYMGQPQGLVCGPDWEDKSLSSSRVVPIGELID